MEEIRFRSGELTLAGTLYFPAGAGPYPAVIMLQGSGPADRDSLGFFPPLRERFVDAGFAVLSWDKPGIGASTGDWRQRTIADRATEALDARAWLRERAEIDPARVGFWGHSQGGWVGPAAAAQVADLAFLVINSGPGIDPPTQDEFGIEHTMRNDGHGDAEVAHGLAYLRALHAAARRAAPYAEVAPIISQTVGQPWGDYFGAIDAEGWQFFVFNDQQIYDPVPALERINCPTLALFGERDLLVPVAESAQIFEQAFARGGNRDLTIHTFPNANHRILVGDPPQFAPGYFAVLTGWLREQVGLEG
jgi:pimeloyl-ACP methyl ester carboxylesterase